MMSLYHRGTILVAQADDVLVGFVAYDTAGDKKELYGLYVKMPFRGYGIGCMLADFAFSSELKELNVFFNSPSVYKWMKLNNVRPWFDMELFQGVHRDDSRHA
jgi:hypothetical protein